MRTWRRAAIVIGTVAVALFATMTPASADNPGEYNGPYWYESNAYIKWYPYGEKLEVCDNKRDGMSARGQLYVPSTDYGDFSNWNSNGAGTCVVHDFNIAEDREVHLAVCAASRSGGGSGGGCRGWFHVRS